MPHRRAIFLPIWLQETALRSNHHGHHRSTLRICTLILSSLLYSRGKSLEPRLVPLMVQCRQWPRDTPLKQLNQPNKKLLYSFTTMFHQTVKLLV